MKKLLILILLLCNQVHFGQCNDPVVKMLRGVWVKETSPTDTIKFAMSIESDYRFELILANKPQGGLFGTYEFRILGTTMLVRSFLSSNSGAEAIPFYFGQNGQVLTIGNFYGSGTTEKTLTFRKIK